MRAHLISFRPIVQLAFAIGVACTGDDAHRLAFAGELDPRFVQEKEKDPGPTQETNSISNSYDPLSVPKVEIEQTLFTIKDAKRDREIPIRVYLPESTKPAAVVLFSHGLGGSRDNSRYLGEHWTGRGYVAVFMQHHGSDESVWKDVPIRQRMTAMRGAADAENFKLRVEDVPAVIDQLVAWNKQDGHPLQGRLDLEYIGMSGHSFGAVTTQAVSGQSFLGRTTFTDSRIKAAIMMSPSAPAIGSADRAFSQVEIPWLMMTGTEDVAPIGNADVESRKAVFEAVPAGDKFELVLDQAEHLAFSDRGIVGITKNRNPNHHRAILAISTAFWDAYLRGDAAAKKWLKDDARKVLDKADTWKSKAP
jgi:predicted dienelactone hydrolase